MIQKAFTAVKNFNAGLENRIEEISVKQSQIQVCFETAEYLATEDLDVLCDIMYPLKLTDIACFNNILYVSFRNLTEDIVNQAAELNKEVGNLYQIISVLKTVVCACPMLEYVVSEDYLKIYLDLSNIQLSNLIYLLDQWSQDPFLELTADRPYLLYINESDFNE